MPRKRAKVYFSRTSQGQEGVSISAALSEAVDHLGPNLPAVELGGDGYQMRGLHRTGHVWTGVFAKLRTDAPNIVNADDEEREIDLEAGDRIVDKCHFVFHARQNVLVWQVNRTAGGLLRAEEYLSQVLDDLIVLPQIMNQAELDRVLQGNLYELSFAYDRPQHIPADAPAWNQRAFDIMAPIHAAQAKFMLRAPRGGTLAQVAKRMVQQLMNSNGIGKIRVRLSDESDPIELFLAPLHDWIELNFVGRYPVAMDVFRELEGAFDRQRHNLAP